MISDTLSLQPWLSAGTSLPMFLSFRTYKKRYSLFDWLIINLISFFDQLKYKSSFMIMITIIYHNKLSSENNKNWGIINYNIFERLSKKILIMVSQFKYLHQILPKHVRIYDSTSHRMPHNLYYFNVMENIKVTHV